MALLDGVKESIRALLVSKIARLGVSRASFAFKGGGVSLVTSAGCAIGVITRIPHRFNPIEWSRFLEQQTELGIDLIVKVGKDDGER